MHKIWKILYRVSVFKYCKKCNLVQPHHVKVPFVVLTDFWKGKKDRTWGKKIRGNRSIVKKIKKTNTLKEVLEYTLSTPDRNLTTLLTDFIHLSRVTDYHNFSQHAYNTDTWLPNISFNLQSDLEYFSLFFNSLNFVTGLTSEYHTLESFDVFSGLDFTNVNSIFPSVPYWIQDTHTHLKYFIASFKNRFMKMFPLDQFYSFIMSRIQFILLNGTRLFCKRWLKNVLLVAIYR